MIPFQQWGGSAKYARKLAERLPEHRRYVEPFCGRGPAVFYAKEKQRRRSLADADPEVAFAHLPQKLDKGFVRRAGEAPVARVADRLPAREELRAGERSGSASGRSPTGRLCTWGRESPT